MTNRVVCVHGETGSGKSTQVPQHPGQKTWQKTQHCLHCWNILEHLWEYDPSEAENQKSGNGLQGSIDSLRSSYGRSLTVSSRRFLFYDVFCWSLQKRIHKLYWAKSLPPKIQHLLTTCFFFLAIFLPFCSRKNLAKHRHRN